MTTVKRISFFTMVLLLPLVFSLLLSLTGAELTGPFWSTIAYKIISCIQGIVYFLIGLYAIAYIDVLVKGKSKRRQQEEA